MSSPRIRTRFRGIVEADSALFLLPRFAQYYKLPERTGRMFLRVPQQSFDAGVIALPSGAGGG
jgi:hypothetical protein